MIDLDALVNRLVSLSASINAGVAFHAKNFAWLEAQCFGDSIVEDDAANITRLGAIISECGYRGFFSSGFVARYRDIANAGLWESLDGAFVADVPLFLRNALAIEAFLNRAAV